MPSIAEDQRFRSNKDRIKNKNDLTELLSKRFLEEDLKYWERTVTDDSLTSAPVNNLQEAFEHPQVKHLNLVQEMYHREMGPMRVIGPVVQYSEAVNRIRSPPPVLGEHTREVLQSELAIENEELEKLKKLRVIQY
ncbi:unnamed protein product [Gongylonema pulchrum]|uniref:GED domain-containing protein n=1 Tax=Gongylonema pulchrum TaxID=637853 RepID=A0A183E492_9BILA|nr:unnamed protein product [Gongylonema pulchrum]